MQSSPGRVLGNCFTLVFAVTGALSAQSFQPQQEVIRQEAPRRLLSPEQLDALVAPIALYPDQLLSQSLAASTYPLELVEAQQWLQQHSDLHGSELIEAAKQLNCDPSVQVMVAFPDALRLLTQNVRWTTDLGNAVLAQQSDVMDAIQRLRAKAHQNGYLTETPRQTVTTQPGPVQNAIAIQPADPQIVQVPAYNPERVWGPAPASAEYPSLWYPSVSSGSGFGSPVEIGSLLTGISGILNWSSWGWGLNWLTRALFLNGSFFNGFGNSGYGGGYADAGGVTAWAHNPAHRLGVPYSNSLLANRFGGTYRGGGRAASYNPPRSSGGFPSSGYRSSPSEGWRSFGSNNGGNSFNRGNSFRGQPSRAPSYSEGRSGNGFRQPSGAPLNYRGDARPSPAPPSNYRGFAEPNQGRTMPRSSSSYAPPRQWQAPREMHAESRMPLGGGRFSAPRSSGHFQAPKPPKMPKAPKFSSHSSGHSSKGRSGGHGKSRRR